MSCGNSPHKGRPAGGGLSVAADTVIPMSVGTPDRPPTVWVSWLALLLSAAAVVLGALALLRAPESSPQARSAETSQVALPTEHSTDGDTDGDACSVAMAAPAAIARDRRPFLEAPPQWDNPITIAALTRVQASALVELEAMRAATGPSTPPQLVDAIAAYRRAVIDMLDADTRRLPAAVSNAASDRAATAARTITDLCKGE